MTFKRMAYLMHGRISEYAIGESLLISMRKLANLCFYLFARCR